MSKKRILVSWIGVADCKAMAATTDKKTLDRIIEAFAHIDHFPKNLDRAGDGPIKTLIDRENFDEIHLLSDYDEKQVGAPFCKWLGNGAKLHPIRKLASPSDYKLVFNKANAILKKIRSDQDRSELCIHLSPGTPTMAAVWVLLGKTRFPATFYQTHRDKVMKEDIPFDITLDFVDEILGNTNLSAQHLLSRSPDDEAIFDSIIGSSAKIEDARTRAGRAAHFDMNVLIIGESGTGKELFAEAIHQNSSRKNGEFRPVNCGGLTDELLASTVKAR